MARAPTQPAGRLRLVQALTWRRVGGALKVKATDEHGQGSHRLKQRKLVACSGGGGRELEARKHAGSQPLVLACSSAAPGGRAPTPGVPPPHGQVATAAAPPSPMHLRRPPPKGRYLKSWVVSLGVGASTGKRSGLNASGSSHSSGDLRQRCVCVCAWAGWVVVVVVGVQGWVELGGGGVKCCCSAPLDSRQGLQSVEVRDRRSRRRRGLGQRLGRRPRKQPAHLCRFQVEMKMSEPLGTL